MGVGKMRSRRRYGLKVPTPAAGRPRHPDVLTPAEWKVLQWVRHGLTRRQIAAHLGTSENAVRYHVRNIRAKLKVDTQFALRRWVGRPADSALARSQEDTVTIEDRTATDRTGVGGIGQIALLVHDTEVASVFYGDVLQLPHLYTFGDLMFFDCAGIRLYLQRVPKENWRPGSILYFTVADITAQYRQLADRGVAFHGAPHLIHRHESGIEEWMAFFDDGQGNTLALMSQVRP